MTSRELRRRSRYCISETSPPKPTMDLELKGLRRFTSVKRARDPYDAEGKNEGVSLQTFFGDMGSRLCSYLNCLLQLLRRP